MSIDEQFDSLIVDCNNAVKYLVNGNYIPFGGAMYFIVQKLSALKETVQNNDKQQAEKIRTLQRFIDDLNNGGNDNGGN